MQRIEEWREIEGFENLYEVSNMGRVKSLPRKHISPKGVEYTRGEIIMKPFDNKGYCYVLLHKDGRWYSRKVHRLVAGAFIPNPLNLPAINHIDYDKHNNSVENLEWISNRDNNAHSACHRPKQRKYKTKSGEPYISMRRGRYRVCITKYRVDKEFDHLDDAIAYRNERLKDHDYKIF